MAAFTNLNKETIRKNFRRLRSRHEVEVKANGDSFGKIDANLGFGEKA